MAFDFLWFFSQDFLSLGWVESGTFLNGTVTLILFSKMVMSNWGLVSWRKTVYLKNCVFIGLVRIPIQYIIMTSFSSKWKLTQKGWRRRAMCIVMVWKISSSSNTQCLICHYQSSFSIPSCANIVDILGTDELVIFVSKVMLNKSFGVRIPYYTLVRQICNSWCT